MDIPLIESDYPYSKNNLNPDFQLWILEGMKQLISFYLLNPVPHHDDAGPRNEILHSGTNVYLNPLTIPRIPCVQDYVRLWDPPKTVGL